MKISIIKEQIELTGMCVKIKIREYAPYGLMRENLAARKYLRLQYTAQTGLPYFDRAAVTAIGCWWCSSLPFSTGVYERKILFSLPFCKYCSKLQTVSEKKLCFGLKKIVGGIIFCLEVPKNRGAGVTPFLP